MKENLGAAKLPDSNPVIAPAVASAGGSIKMASLPRQGKSPTEMTACERSFCAKVPVERDLALDSNAFFPQKPREQRCARCPRQHHSKNYSLHCRHRLSPRLMMHDRDS